MSIEVSDAELHAVASRHRIRTRDEFGGNREDGLEFLRNIAETVCWGFNPGNEERPDFSGAPEFYVWLRGVCLGATDPQRTHPRKLFAALGDLEVWDFPVPGVIAEAFEESRDAAYVGAPERPLVERSRETMASAAYAVMCDLFGPDGRKCLKYEGSSLTGRPLFSVPDHENGEGE